MAADPISEADPELQSGVEGQHVALQIGANDSNAALLYTATGLPDGLSLNPTTGLIWGVIAPGDAATGPYFVTVTTYGADSAVDSQSFEWDVSSPVTVATIADKTNAEGDPVNLGVGGADLYGGVPSFGAAGLPPGLSISSTGVISGVIAAGAADDGPYSVTVTATDGTYSGNQTFTWNVTGPIPPDSPPYVPPPVVPDTGPVDCEARDQAWLPSPRPAPTASPTPTTSTAAQDAVFSTIVWPSENGAGLTTPVAFLVGGSGLRSNRYPRSDSAASLPFKSAIADQDVSLFEFGMQQGGLSHVVRPQRRGQDFQKKAPCRRGTESAYAPRESRSRRVGRRVDRIPSGVPAYRAC